MKALGWSLLLSCVATPAVAQQVSPLNPVTVDTSALATKADIAAVQSAMPKPATTIPPSEALGGSVGTPGTYRPADSAIPRITRAGSCTLTAGGVCSVVWSTPLLTAPTVVLTPVNTAGLQPIICNPTAMPTTAGVTFKCWTVQTTTLSLAIITAGLILAPATAAPAGTVVQVIALPPTQ